MTERVSGAIIGFRRWRLEAYNLHALNQKYSWTAGVNTAQCLRQWFQTYGDAFGPRTRRDPHMPPGHDCDCGLYAFHDPVETQTAWILGKGPGELIMIGGAIRAWGRVEVHANGFRAQHAEPVLFSYSDNTPVERADRIRTVGEELGIPTVHFRDLHARALEYGRSIKPQGTAA